MIIFLLGVIIVLGIIVFYQYKSIKNRNNNLEYIHKKISDIISNKTSEKLLVSTDDYNLIDVLIEINNLLDYNQKMTANYMKTEKSIKKMLSNISHDLKTPITVIRGYIEILMVDDTLSEKEKKILLSKVQDKTVELINLVNKFFDLAKLESGDKDIILKKVNINEICRKNILSFFDILTNKGIDVIINIPDESFFILGNEEALDRILNNLISNAIKYGSDGRVIGIDLKTDEQFIYIDVWDKGKGINEQHKNKVFERLYTLDDSRNKSYESSGLGLTITKKLVEKLNGEINIISRPYERTSFNLKFERIKLL